MTSLVWITMDDYGSAIVLHDGPLWLIHVIILENLKNLQNSTFELGMVHL